MKVYRFDVNSSNLASGSIVDGFFKININPNNTLENAIILVEKAFILTASNAGNVEFVISSNACHNINDSTPGRINSIINLSPTVNFVNLYPLPYDSVGTKVENNLFHSGQMHLRLSNESGITLNANNVQKVLITFVVISE